jgi:hypothetical protein
MLRGGGIMTDKQMIYNGVDVSGCEFYWLEKDICNNGNLTSDCQEHKDCIYKRYIRKEQECEELKQTLIEIEKLAIQGNRYCLDYNVDDCEKCIKQYDCKTTLFKQILEKISEVEDE